MAVHPRTRTVLQRSALSAALSMCFIGGLQAQSNTAGAIFGQAATGATVQVQNPSTGFSRTITVGADGAYRFSALPAGTYTVTYQGSDGTSSTREGVNVSVGTGTPVNFSSASATSTLDTITVRASTSVNPIDVSSVESTSILSAEQIAKMPVLRDTTSVALLAPGTVRGDNAFGNLASFGGSSVAENQYYVNGFNATNTFRNLDFAQVPFEAISQSQVKTGGYGAEFGRSTGGVVNQITKRGTNEFHAGGNVFWSPKGLQAEQTSFYLNNPLDPGSSGELYRDNSGNFDEQWTTALWAGGALIQDKLFAYGLVQYGREKNALGATEYTEGNGTRRAVKRPNWLVKLDWDINENNKLEFTGFNSESESEEASYRYGTNAKIGTNYTEDGGKFYIGKYTGYLTDTFTVSALYGNGTFTRNQHLRTADGLLVEYGGNLNEPATGCPRILDARPTYRQNITGTYSSNCNITDGSIDRRDAQDERNQYRIDAEWSVGDHLIRFGYDRDDFESVAGQSIEGGRLWRYSTVNPDGIANSGDETDIVREQIVNQGSTVKLKQWAFYVEDSWKITDNFLAYLGARWDTFENLNGEGQSYVKIDKQFGPRLGFSWDVNGDSTLKIYGNAGRYALPLTPSVAVRGASASLFTRQNFNYTGVDPQTGAPIGTTPRGGLSYVNGEFGEPKNPATIASTNLDPMYQDEFILGFQKQLTDHQNIGARGIYRKLKAAIDDNCDYTPIYNQAVADGYEPVLPNSGFPYCRMFNPGKDSVFLTDLEDNGQLTEYTVAADLLSPKAKRSYKALELFWDGGWDRLFLQGSWTIGWNKGNTEGGVKSDIGQADTSVTQDFDYKELMVDAYGYLPNDRRHSFKLFGAYQITDEWSIGGNVLVQSGRPKNCLGVLYPYNGGIHPYGSSFFRCGTTEAGGADGPSVAVPRGTAGRLPWTNTIDLNVAYFPSWAPGLQFKMDVFNVFDNQKVTAISEVAEDATTGAPLATYGRWRSTQAPRSFRFMVQYDF
ncbi:TonB-dependent receptor [Pseudoxanthomonas composti]|uniref:TonB-dependent receptor n=1 Tax=Pseudoxanthomonas composti TaxID=2137479 RepID=UPI0013E917E9|nr:TonB-dependent receptor [Pseudoxanthomonas composti]